MRHLKKVGLLATASSRCFTFLLGLILLTSVGCDMDSFLDPSVVGRWESTPVVLPILDRLDVIEEPEDAIPGLSQPTSQDLIPEIVEYQIGPGDRVVVRVFELLEPGREAAELRRVDELGFMRLPVIGQIRAGGLSAKQLEQKIVNILHPDILRDPTVTVSIEERSQNTFNIIGATNGVGTYTLHKSDYRLLDAIAMSRGFAPETEKIYIIRQVSLNEIVDKGTLGDKSRSGDYLPPMKPTDTQQPGQSEPGEEFDPAKLIEQLTNELEGGSSEDDDPEPQNNFENKTAPGNGEAVATPLAGALEPEQTPAERWVNIDGKWVAVEVAPTPVAGDDQASQQPSIAAGVLPSPDELVTQRVIEIDAKKLMKGVAKYNIIIRPDDIIRIPPTRSGNLYISGEIARPGTYSVPAAGITLTRLIASAGGLGPIAIPERVDIRRKLSNNTEAIVRLNYRAIGEGVQPDIFLKADDHINIGTNVLASFLAVIRNGFRVSYGFGFLLDRNFDDKVFGFKAR